MRFVRFAPAIAATVSAVFLSGLIAAPALAQDSPTRIIIRKAPERSFLDPGTVIRPGTGRYNNYVTASTPRVPTYGGDGGITGSRFPLPQAYELPGF
ncbi:hypothetical protein MWN34_16075 [Ancylobacter sp. 6x-1]|uniref:Uncharacterized protein n=1 Tax=Ancylobacter crimeensis TaxID=2579147 RepID=A0ABT0DEP4_9HYPH|nr:hypothetical protein [Ancylobacter crimeensis]MCK0198431.1 hypothetical protein [Ancylobacter crimeensis]